MVKSGPIGGRVCWYAKQRGLKQGTFEAVEPRLRATGTEEEREREERKFPSQWRCQVENGNRTKFFFLPRDRAEDEGISFFPIYFWYQRIVREAGGKVSEFLPRFLPVRDTFARPSKEFWLGGTRNRIRFIKNDSIRWNREIFPRPDFLFKYLLLARSLAAFHQNLDWILEPSALIFTASLCFLFGLLLAFFKVFRWFNARQQI